MTGQRIEVPSNDWKFGYDSKGEAKTRIIVTHRKDTSTWVRVYDPEHDQKDQKEKDKIAEDSECYFCVGCINKKRIKNCAELKRDGTLWIPTFHDCEKIDIAKNESEQKTYEEKFVKMQRSAASTPMGNGRASNPFLIRERTSSSTPIFISPEPPTRASSVAQRSVPASSRSSSPVFVTPGPPAKAAASTAQKSNVNRSSSPVVVYSSNSQTPHSDKAKITNYFSKTSSCRNSTPKSTPLKPPAKMNTAETPLQLRRQRQSKNAQDKENQEENSSNKTTAEKDDAEPKNVKIKRTLLDSNDEDVEIVEADVPPVNEEDEINPDIEHGDFDDHPALYDSGNQYPLQQESAAATGNNANEKILESPAATVSKEVEEVAQQQQSTSHPKAVPTKRTFIEDDVVLLEAATATGSEINSENVSTSNAQTAVTPATLPPNPVTPKPSSSSHVSATPKDKTTKKTNEKLTPARINAMEKREYKLGEYEFGVNGRNVPNERIIVPEDVDDKTLFREFHKYQNKWYCRACQNLNKKRVYAILKNGIFYAPPQHLCKAITRQEWENDQELIKDKYSHSTRKQQQQPQASNNVSSSSEEEEPEPIVCRTRRSAAAAANESSINATSTSTTEEPVVYRTRRSAAANEPNNTSSTSTSATEAINSSSRPSTSMSSSTATAATPSTSHATTPAATSNRMREIDISSWEYTVDENGKQKGRLIVRELNDSLLARVYIVTNAKEWKCLKCNIGFARKIDDPESNNQFLVSINHECSPISRSILKADEKRFIEKQQELSGKKASERLSSSSSSTTTAAELQQPRSESQMSRETLNSSVQTNNSNMSFSSSTQQQQQQQPSSTSSTSKSTQLSPHQWEWGCDANGNEKKRIIVPDLHNPQYAHEYRNGGLNMLCLGCHRVKKSSKIFASRNDDEVPVVSIPSPEEHNCKPRKLDEIREQQKLYARKGKKRGRSDTENDDLEAEEVHKKRTRRSAIVERDTETTTSPIGDDDVNVETDFDTPEYLAAADHLLDEPMVEDVADTVPVQNYALSNHSTTVKFYRPADWELENLCNRISSSIFSLSTYEMWAKIKIRHITPTSIPSAIHPISDQERSGFASLSLFLSGTESNALLIKDTFIDRYFCENLPQMGQYYGEDLSRINTGNTIKIMISNVLTKYHLQALCQFFDCRIGIFVDGKWCRYGNWNDENAHVVTFLMKQEGNQFRPILSLQ